MSPYGKIFDLIFGSSIMEKEVEIRYIWMCMIVSADKEGFIDETIPALARRFNIPVENMEEAIKCFLEPDSSSRNPVNNGKRIEPIRETFGWRILNYDHYRNLRDDDQRRSYMREYMRNYRQGKKVTPLNPVNNGKHQLTPVNGVNFIENNGKQRKENGPKKETSEKVKSGGKAITDADVNTCKPLLAHTDTDTDTKKERESKTAFRKHVMLTQKQYESLIEKHGEEKTKWILDKLNLAKETHGYKYKSDYGAINSWVIKAWEQEQGQDKDNYKSKFPVYGSKEWKERYPEK